MSKAYLAWPVKLILPTLKGVRLEEAHVTLKYIGETEDAERLIKDICERLSGKLVNLDLDKVRWTATKFNPSTYVLELHDLDPVYQVMRDAVADLRQEDYPGWRPHITVPKATWQEIKTRMFSVPRVIEGVGPLTLYVDKKPAYTWAIHGGPW